MTTMLAAAVAVSAVPVEVVRAAARETDPIQPPTRVQLQVDVTGLKHADHDEAHHAAITRFAMTRDLKAVGVQVAPADTTGDPVISFALRWINFDLFVYELAASVTPKNGKRRELKTRECNDCTDDELLAMMALQLDEALDILRESESEPEPEPEFKSEPEVVTSGPSEGTEPAQSSTQESPSDESSFPFVGVGIGVATLGVGGLVGGGVLVGRETSEDGAARGFLEGDRVAYRTPGFAALAAGGVVLAAGVALIVIGERRKAKQADKHSGSASARRRITWTPSLTGISGKF